MILAWLLCGTLVAGAVLATYVWNTMINGRG